MTTTKSEIANTFFSDVLRERQHSIGDFSGWFWKNVAKWAIFTPELILIFKKKKVLCWHFLNARNLSGQY